jgi:RNA polymerase sigma-70 factor, ECF subfamily
VDPLEGLDVEIEDLRQEVRRAARGDEDSAALLFDHYYPRVYRYAFGKLRRHSDAEDVAAETFARALRRLDRFKWKGAGFEAWLFRIASNLVVDFYRSSGREEVSDDMVARQILVEDLTPEDLVITGDNATEIINLIEELPDDQREVILLRFAGGLDTKAVARVTKRNANAVRQLQFRALQNLRKRVKKPDDE